MSKIYTKKDNEGKVTGYYFNTYYKDTFGNTKRKHSGTYAKKKDCERALLEFQNSIASGNVETNCTLDDLYDMFYSEKKKTCSIRRLQGIYIHYSLHIKPTLGEVKINKITSVMCREWFDKLCARDDLGIAYKNSVKQTLKAIIQFGVDYELIPKNPMTVVKNLKETSRSIEEVDNIKTHVISEEQFLKCLSYIEYEKENINKKLPREYIFYIALYTLFYTGFRIGELRALTPSDLHLESNYISVTKSFSQNSNIITLPKTKSSIRKVYIDNGLKRVLQEYVDILKTYKGYNDSCFLFGFKHPIVVKDLRNTWNYIQKKNNIDTHLTIHDIRHCRASYLICNGFNIAFVSKQLGHADVSITLKVYTELMSDTEEMEFNKLVQLKK